MGKRSYSYSSAQTIIDEHLRMVGDDVETSIEFLQTASLVQAINMLKRKIWHAPMGGMFIGSRLVPPRNSGMGWDFAEEEKPFTFVVKTTTTAQITTASSSIPLTSASDYSNESGAIIVYNTQGAWDYITYTGLSGSSLTGTAGSMDIDATWASGVEVQKLYKLSTNFESAKELFVAEEKFDPVRSNPIDGYYALINGFLWMPRNIGSTNGTLTYWKKPTDVTEATLSTSLDTPDILDEALIELLNARAYRLNGNAESDIQNAENAAYSCIMNAMGFTTASGNTRINLLRQPKRSPYLPFGGVRSSNFDEGSGY